MGESVVGETNKVNSHRVRNFRTNSAKSTTEVRKACFPTWVKFTQHRSLLEFRDLQEKALESYDFGAFPLVLT